MLAPNLTESENTPLAIGGAAALLQALVEDDLTLANALADWLSESSSGSIGTDLSVHRAVVTVLAPNPGMVISQAAN